MFKRFLEDLEKRITHRVLATMRLEMLDEIHKCQDYLKKRSDEVEEDVNDYIKKERVRAEEYRVNSTRAHAEHAAQIEGYLKGFNEILEKKL